MLCPFCQTPNLGGCQHTDISFLFFFSTHTFQFLLATLHLALGSGKFTSKLVIAIVEIHSVHIPTGVENSTVATLLLLAILCPHIG